MKGLSACKLSFQRNVAMLAAAPASINAKAPLGAQRCQKSARQRPWKLSETRERRLVFIGREYLPQHPRRDRKWRYRCWPDLTHGQVE
jgi:hypothetical protein